MHRIKDQEWVFLIQLPLGLRLDLLIEISRQPGDSRFRELPSAKLGGNLFDSARGDCISAKTSAFSDRR
jgi:hypothetical protein